MKVVVGEYVFRIQIMFAKLHQASSRGGYVQRIKYPHTALSPRRDSDGNLFLG